MNKFSQINPVELQKNPFSLLNDEWGLLTAGNKENFNTMTIAWGSLGVMWNKFVVTTAVRPNRYTFEFVEKNDSFSLSFFGMNCRKELMLLGSKSGKDSDKIKESGLTADFSNESAPFFCEAEIVMICRKIYFEDINPANFLIPEIEKHYPLKDYHRLYMGEITAVYQK